MSPKRIETQDDLHEVIGAQNAAIEGLHTLVRAMDARIKLLTELVDAHHKIFVRQGICKPRPTGDQHVN